MTQPTRRDPTKGGKHPQKEVEVPKRARKREREKWLHMGDIKRVDISDLLSIPDRICRSLTKDCWSVGGRALRFSRALNAFW